VPIREKSVKHVKLDAALVAQLFSCQRDAIDKIEAFLLAPRSSKAALIQMPMGTGKTGLMALASSAFPAYGKTLIVAPAEYLTRQIKKEITRTFWEHAELAAPDWLSAETFTPSTYQALDSSTRVLICTVQTLQQLHTSNDPSIYETLRRSVDLVIFDEGHREPALTWAKAIRELQKKTILFTATPYRNDERKFAIDPKFKYVFHHNQAEAEHIVRHVDIGRPYHASTTDAFVTLLRKQLRLEAVRFHDPRILVRCASANEIVTLVQRLNRRQPGSAMGFHSAIPESDFLKRKVPDLAQIPSTVRFFVHEKLLIEGVDEKRFTCLAIYGRMHNSRELIQQVGRVIRNSTHKPETATVLVPKGSVFKRWWNNYLAAQKDPSGWWYASGEFRKSFDPNEAAPDEDISFTLSARVFQVSSAPDVRQLVNELIDELQEHEFSELHRSHSDRHNTTVVLYSLEEQVTFIQHKTYVQGSLGYFVVHLEQDLLFYFDSHGLSPALLDERFLRVPARKLQKLLGGDGSRITYVDLANCDVSRTAVRSRSARAFSIEEALHSLNDHSHYCRTARGLPEADHSFGRRYVGFGRSRVSDSSKADWRRFHEWTKSVAELIRRNSQPPRVFNRFAELIAVPKNPLPTSVLLDFDDIEDHIVTVKGSPISDIPEMCVDVDDRGAFSLQINGESVPVLLVFEEKKSRFVMKSAELHANYRVKGEDSSSRSKSLLSYLNQEQSFRLTLTEHDLLYGAGSFFRPRWRLSDINSESEIPMRECFVPIPGLSAITSEKGSCSLNHTGWETDSLFGMLDRSTKTGRNGFTGLPWLVCDDAGRAEIADFVGLDPGHQRVVFVHAKSKQGSLSGSFFHEICGQVKKNLDYAHRYSSRTPPNLSLWRSKWLPAGDKFPAGDYIRKRVRRPAKVDGPAFWTKVKELLSNPNSSVEIWMLLGQGFEFDRYVEELCGSEPQPQVVQIAYQLQSTLDAVSQIGARLKILCRR
jgi:hypothetical protein